MLIKKDEVFTLMHGIRDESNKPMMALQDFDLVSVANRIVDGMDEHGTDLEAWILIERLEDLGLAKPIVQRLIRIIPGIGEITTEAARETPRITERPQ
ncbi:hypothetical protein [Pseudomonas putida]|uniref:hypothetical protein n=1 Tax=Pseudomonas putida TaxID=303 RepID=UPI000EF6AD39|nr:hypothetical protein [Pseudomonas putida]AYN11801.1 hypothetical protein CHN49_18775 [Pseudomonas putida]